MGLHFQNDALFGEHIKVKLFQILHLVAMLSSNKCLCSSSVFLLHIPEPVCFPTVTGQGKRMTGSL